ICAIMSTRGLTNSDVLIAAVATSREGDRSPCRIKAGIPSSPKKKPRIGRGLGLAMSAAHFFGHGDWKPYPRKESVWVMHILPRLFGPGAAYHSFGWAEFAAYDPGVTA